jgi:hypothetical protein
MLCNLRLPMPAVTHLRSVGQSGFCLLVGRVARVHRGHSGLVAAERRWEVVAVEESADDCASLAPVLDLDRMMLGVVERRKRYVVEDWLVEAVGCMTDCCGAQVEGSRRSYRWYCSGCHVHDCNRNFETGMAEGDSKNRMRLALDLVIGSSGPGLVEDGSCSGRQDAYSVWLGVVAEGQACCNSRLWSRCAGVRREMVLGCC